jgi:hypothetical protein
VVGGGETNRLFLFRLLGQSPDSPLFTIDFVLATLVVGGFASDSTEAPCILVLWLVVVVLKAGSLMA